MNIKEQFKLWQIMKFMVLIDSNTLVFSLEKLGPWERPVYKKFGYKIRYPKLLYERIINS